MLSLLKYTKVDTIQLGNALSDSSFKSNYLSELPDGSGIKRLKLYWVAEQGLTGCTTSKYSSFPWARWTRVYLKT